MANQEIIQEYLGVPNIIPRVFISGRDSEGGPDTWQGETKPNIAAFEGGHEPCNTDGFWKLEKAKEWILPLSLQKEMELANTSVLAQRVPIVDFWTPEEKEKKSVLL